MANVQILNQDDIDNVAAPDGTFVAVQTSLGTTQRRSLNGSIAAKVQTPLRGNVDAAGFKIINADDPINQGDYVTLAYANINFVINPLTDNINAVGVHKFINAIDPSNPQDYVTLNYLDTNFVAKLFTSDVNANNFKITNLPDPSSNGEPLTLGVANSEFVRNPFTQNINADQNRIVNAADPVNPQDYVTKAFGDANYLVGEDGANKTLSNLIAPTALNENLNMSTKALTFPSTFGPNSLHFVSNLANEVQLIQTGGAVVPITSRMIDSDATFETEFTRQIAGGLHIITYQSVPALPTSQIVTQNYRISPSSDTLGISEAILNYNFARIGGAAIIDKPLVQWQNNGLVIATILANGTFDFNTHILSNVDVIQYKVRSTPAPINPGFGTNFVSSQDDDHATARFRNSSGTVFSLTKSSIPLIVGYSSFFINDNTPRIFGFTRAAGLTDFNDELEVETFAGIVCTVSRVFLTIFENGTNTVSPFALRVDGVTSTILTGSIPASATGNFIAVTSTLITVEIGEGFSLLFTKGSSGTLQIGTIGALINTENTS